MYNIARLRGKIAEKGMTQAELAKAIQIDKSTLNRKLKNGESFTIGEARRIACTLELTRDDLMEIFFTQTVA